jgi:hypothetical protein
MGYREKQVIAQDFTTIQEKGVIREMEKNIFFDLCYSSPVRLLIPHFP